MKLLPHHPLADLFPMIGPEELNRFTADIKANGLQRPILTVKVGRQLMIADGRTRQLACEAAGVEPRFEQWDGKGSLIDVVCSLNLRHRTMSKTDLAIAAEAATEHIEGAAVNDAVAKMQTEAFGSKDKLTSTARADLAAALFNVSPRYLYQVRSIRKTSPKVYRQMVDREINLSQAILRVDRARRAKESAAKAETAKVSKGALKLICGDALAELEKLTGGSARVIFIDPPYNNGWMYDSDPTGDRMALDDYLDWMDAVFIEASRVLAPNGSLFVLVDDNLSDLIGFGLRRCGLHRRNTMSPRESLLKPTKWTPSNGLPTTMDRSRYGCAKTATSIAAWLSRRGK